MSEIFRNANGNFEIIFPLTDDNKGNYVTGKASELDSNTILIYYHNATVWIAASFSSGTPVELGSTGLYHITILTSWFTARDEKYPIVIKIVDDSGTKTWVDQGIIIQPNLEINKLYVTGNSVNEAVSFSNLGAGNGLKINSVNGDSLKINSDNSRAIDLSSSLTCLRAISSSARGLDITGATDGALIQGQAGKGLHLKATQQAIHSESTVSGIGFESTSFKLDNTGFAVSPMNINGTGAVPSILINSAADNGLEITALIRGISIIADEAQGIYSESLNEDGLKLVGNASAKDINAKEINSILTDTNNIVTNLPVIGPIASQGDVQALSNNTKMRISYSPTIVYPSTGNTIVVPIKAYFYDNANNPEDPDSNEIAIQIRATNAATYKTALYDDEATTSAATSSTTFTPSFLKMTRTGVGQYETYYLLPHENNDIWVMIFKLNEATVEMTFSANMNLIQQAATLELADTSTTRQIIAKSLKIEDVQSEIAVSDSVYKDLKNNTDAIVAKLPATGIISNLNLTTVIDGIPLEKIFKLQKALVNGRYLQNSPVDGQMTIFEEDNSTILTILNFTESERTRIQ